MRIDIDIVFIFYGGFSTRKKKSYGNNKYSYYIFNAMAVISAGRRTNRSVSTRGCPHVPDGTGGIAVSGGDAYATSSDFPGTNVNIVFRRNASTLCKPPSGDRSRERGTYIDRTHVIGLLRTARHGEIGSA